MVFGRTESFIVFSITVSGNLRPKRRSYHIHRYSSKPVPARTNDIDIKQRDTIMKIRRSLTKCLSKSNNASLITYPN